MDLTQIGHDKPVPNSPKATALQITQVNKKHFLY